MEIQPDSEKRNIFSDKNIRKTIRLMSGVAVGTAALIIIFYFCVKRYDGLKAGIATFTTILRPFLIGFATAFIMNPVMMFFETRLNKLILPRVKNKENARVRIRLYSSIIAILILVAAIVIFLIAVIPQIIQTLTYIFSNLELQLINVLEWADNVTGKRFTDVLTDAKQIENIENFIKKVQDLFMKYLNWEETNTMVQEITSGVIDVGKIIAHILIGLFASIYFLMDKEKYKAISKKMLYGIFPIKVANPIMDVIRKADDIFYGFFVGKIIDSIIIGLICYVSMLIFGWNYPVLVSVIIGVTNIIPIFGPYIGAVPTVTILFFTNPMQGIYFLIYIIILQQVDGNIIGPKILGDSTGVSAFWVLFAIVTGGGLFGFIGMLFGVPIVALLYYILSKVFIYLTRNKGLPIYTMEYENLHSVDPATKQIIVNESAEKKKILLFESIAGKFGKGKDKNQGKND